MKKLLLLGGAAFLASTYFGKQKITEIRNVIDSLILRVNGIRNFKFDLTGLNFDIDLNITNPTTENLNLQTGNMITLRRLLFYTDQGEFIGQSFPNLTGIEIPANGTINIANLRTHIDTGNIGTLINNAIGLFIDPSKLQVKAEIESLGKLYTI
ncbi:hypothetical protein U6A24_12590 [Aquimarina gracilis]|uniref:Late embryogenesis abundant protein LEA-2 subgroup domain-containing protein n=1 Tax=Aquimarina gracilis TaxID=874422 RepID=A0ABU5ZWR1_9FLAO|nr:hypothetical protein [Aquimarina gracilis]MEB3346307.1 hypothetical protein [Aquimarina gracilis]